MAMICTLVKDDCPKFKNGLCITDEWNSCYKAQILCDMDGNKLQEINIIYLAKILKTQKQILKELQRQK